MRLNFKLNNIAGNIVAFFIIILIVLTSHGIIFSQSVGITGDSDINRCETKSFTISILNNSGNSLTSAVVTAKMLNLTGFSYVTGTSAIDVNGGAPFCTIDPVPSGTDLVWDIDNSCPGSPFTLNNGDTLNITFQLSTGCSAVSGSLNVGFVYEIGGTPFPDETGVLNIQVNPGAVTIKKTLNVIPQKVGQDVTWTLTIENTGFGVIENVEVTDVLGAGLSYVSSTQSGNNSGQTTNWTSNEYAALASMDPGDVLTMDITATVIACQFLDNNADVRFGCDPSPLNTCFDTAVNGGTATASVQRIVTSPLIQYTPPDISFTYCDDTESVNFLITNAGDGSANDLWIGVDFGSLAVSNVSSGVTYNNISKRFEFANPIPPSGTYTLSFDLTYSAWCGGSFPTGDLLWQNVYKDECDNDFYPPVYLSNINAPANTPSLSVTKGGAGSVIQIGDQVTYTIECEYSGPITCGSGTMGPITIVDTIPDGFTVVDPAGGTVAPGSGGTGGTITWTYLPSDPPFNESIILQSPLVSDCETYCNTIYLNSVTASGTDCCGCELSATASETSAIECEEGVDSEKTSSGPTERCDSTDYTNTYTFSGVSSVILNNLQFDEHAENLQEYVPGSLSVALTGSGDITGSVSVTDNTPGGSLLLDFSGAGATPLAGQTLTITYSLTATAATIAACTDNTFYSWSSMEMGTTGSECLSDGIIHETVPVSIVSPSMSVSVSGLGTIVNKCDTQAITINLTQTSADSNPKDVRLVLSGLNYYVVNPAATVCGGIAPVSCTPIINGSGDYVWEFGDAFTGSGQTATLQLTVQKRCSGAGDLTATAYFDDRCTDDSTVDELCSASGSDSPALLLGGDLLIEKTPEVYYANTNQVEWVIYVTNRGSGKAINVWADDVLGAGLDYVSTVVDNMTGVIITADQDHNGNAANGATISIAEMAAGERRQITFTALLIDCNNLTNEVSASWGCIGVECQTVVTDNSSVKIPAPNLINTNTITPAGGVNACSSPRGFVTLRNAGQVTCYNLQVTETLPPNLLYVSGSTRWRLNGGTWNGPNAAYDPSPVTSPLVWTSAQISSLASAGSGDTIEIEFDMSSDCPFTGGSITVSTQYENPCADVFTTSDSTFTAVFNAPTVNITKTRANTPINCGELIEWTITVQNTSGYTLPLIWVEDILDASFTYDSSFGDPPFTADNGSYDGINKVAWELRNVNHNDTVVLTLRATTDSSPCSPSLDNTVYAWWGCGAADGSSLTKPGVDSPDNNLCLTSTSISDVRTETREPGLSYFAIAMSPLTIDSCNDSTELTITIENTGPTDARNVDLVLTLPPGLSYITGTSLSGLSTDQGSAIGSLAGIGDPAISGGGTILTWYDTGDKASDIADTIQADGGNDTLVLRFNVQSSCYVTDDIDITMNYYDCCDDRQYSADTSVTVDSNFPDLTVTKTPVNSQVECGQNQTWTITVTNNGTGNAEVVRVEDTLGDWLDYVSSGGPHGTATSMGGQVYGWEINNLASGASTTFTITGRLNPIGLPNQVDCDLDLRENEVQVYWGCGTIGDATDGDPNTTSYDCVDSSPVTAAPAVLQMPDLRVINIEPLVTCSSDGVFTGTIQVRLRNSGNGANLQNFDIVVTDGLGWTGTYTYTGTLNAGARQWVTIDTSTWTPDCNSCTAYSITATVDPAASNTVCECDETNNTLIENYTAPIPDLTITDIDFTNVSCSNDNMSGYVTVAVSNTGCATASNVPVSLSTDGCLSFPNVTIGSLAAGASTNVTFNISGSWSDCTSETCQFTAEVDPTGIICECDGTNNTRVENYSTVLPDLVVTDIDFTNISCVNDSISGTVDVTIQNSGFGSANNFEVSLTTDGCLTFSNETVTTALGNGMSTIVTFNVSGSWADCTDCSCVITATVDSENDVCECDGTNNQLSEPYMSTLPDLRVNTITPSAACISDGNLSGTVVVNVENIGCGNASNVVVRLISTCGIVFADQTLNLNAGTDTDLTFNYTPDCSNCTCTFLATIDPGNTICECTGTNNSAASTPFTYNIPDIQIQSDTLSVSCSADGQATITGNVTLTNTGCGAIPVSNVPMRITMYDNTGCAGNVLDQWTQNFAGVSIAPGGGTQSFAITPRTVTSDLAVNSTGCQVSFRIEADYNSSICECDGSNNSYCADNKPVNIPDLEVSSDTLGVSCLSDGQVTISGTVTMENNGCGSNMTNNIPVRFTIYDNTGCSGNVLSQWTQTFAGANIAAGGGTQVFAVNPRNITSNMIANSTGCQVSIRVEADYTNSICETDGTDNTYCADNKVIDIPDLLFSGDTLGVSCLSDGQVTVSGTVTIANNGCGSNMNSNVPVRFTLYDNTACGGNMIDQWTETLAGSNIPAGGGTQVFSITSRNITTNLVNNSNGCMVSIRAEADYSGSICESDGTNNTLCSNKAVSIPDLRVNTVTPSATCLSDGNLSGSVIVNVENIGCADAANVVVRLASDCGVTFTDQTVNLNQGSNTDVTFNYTPDCSNCVCTFSATIDPDNSVCESSGSNNALTSAPYTMNIPDIEISSDSLSVSCLTDGQSTVSGTITMINSGCGSALVTDVPVRITMYDNTGCTGNIISQWTETLSGINISSGGGSQTLAISSQTIVSDLIVNSTGCQVSFRIEADYNNTICECDGTNNNWCADNKMVDIPDLEVSSDTLAVSCLSDGQVSVSGAVTMANNGCGSNLTNSIPVRFTLYDNTGCAGNMISQWTETLSTVNIPAGGGTQTFTITPQNITTNIVSNSTGCQVSIRVETDYTNSICETDGTDNTYCADNKNIDIPDIEVQSDSIAVSCSDDGSAAVSGNVVLVNNGCGSNLTDDISMRFTIYDDTGCSGNQVHQWTETFSAVNMAAGGGNQTFAVTSQTLNLDMVANSTNCRVSVLIEPDYTGVICESDGNNITCSDKDVVIPDLNINSSPPVTSCFSDGNLQVQFVVSNEGCSDINTNFNIRISDDAGQTRTVTFTGLGGTLPLNQGGNQTITIEDWSFDCGSGSIDFDIILDVDNDICESGSANNTVSFTHTLSGPDLLFGTVTSVCNSNATIDFTIPIENQGYGDATGVVLNVYDDTAIIYTQTFNLASGNTTTINFTSGPYQGDVDHHFRFVLDEAETVCECNGTNNEALLTVNCPTTGLVTGKTVLHREVSGCSEVEFTLTATNVGFLNAYNIIIQDILPRGFKYIAGSTTAAWPAGTYSSDPVITGDTLEWNIGTTLYGGTPTGDSITLTFRALSALCSEGGRFVNSMRVTGDDGSGVPIPPAGSDAEDNDPDDSSSTDVILLCPELEVKVECPVAELVAPGELFETRIIVTNKASKGNGFRSLVITDLLPDGWILDSFTTSGGNLSSSPVSGGEGLLSWAFNNVSIGEDESIILTLKLKADSRACGTVNSETIRVETIDGCGDKFSFTDSCSVKVVCGVPVLKLQKYCPRAEQPGGIYKFEITLENSGDVSSDDVVINDLFPEGFVYLEGTSALNGIKIDDPSGTSPSTWKIGTINPGEIKTLAYSMIAPSDLDPGEYCNEAFAEGLGQDKAKFESNISRCCTVLRRDLSGCCIDIEQWVKGFYKIPELPISFIDPYFNTEEAMFAVYSSIDFIKTVDFGDDSMAQFVRNRIRNYALSTVEEFYLRSGMGKELSDGSIYLSYGGSYPERDKTVWKSKRVNKTMTSSQIAFELLALNNAISINEDELKNEQLKKIMDEKLKFISRSLRKNSIHEWEVEKKRVTSGKDELTKKDLSALYFAASELKGSGVKGAIEFLDGIITRMDNINGKFNKGNFTGELLTAIGLLKNGNRNYAEEKIDNLRKLIVEKEISPDSIFEYSLAIYSEFKIRGTFNKELFDEMKKKYYVPETGIFSEKQSDFTHRLSIKDLGALMLSFEPSLTRIQRIFHANILPDD